MEALGQENQARGAVALGKLTTSKTAPALPAKWRVGTKGQIEHSADGSNWEAVVIDSDVTFRAVSWNEGDLWAGGTGGALFHSSDSGRTWSRVKVGMEGMWVSDTITGVDFPTERTGYVTTASGALWYTQNAGRSWRRR
jgi:photosystem II stability/assembly factor-like uncharacterized protein